MKIISPWFAFPFQLFFDNNLIFQANQFVFSLINTFAWWMLFISWSWYIYFCWLTEVLMEGGDAPWPAHRWKSYLKNCKTLSSIFSLQSLLVSTCGGYFHTIFFLYISMWNMPTSWWKQLICLDPTAPTLRTMSAKTEFSSMNNVLLLRKIGWRDTFFSSGGRG